jgi:hypothetical protein
LIDSIGGSAVARTRRSLLHAAHDIDGYEASIGVAVRCGG